MEEITHKKGKIYYSMGEVSEMFDVNPSLIRFWEKKFDILKPHKNKKGNRLFTPQDVDNLKLIYHLVKEKGMTLAGAEKVLKENKEGTVRDIEIADRLLAIKSMLIEIREELKTEGEIISPEGYLDEEEIISDAGYPAIGNEPETSQDDFVLITEKVRVEVVTDGSSPWKEESPSKEKEEEPVDESQRQVAMAELSNIKNILDGWDEPDERESVKGDQAALIVDAPSPVPQRETVPTSPVVHTTSNELFDLDDSEDDYSDPWEEVGEEPDGTDMFEPAQPSGHPVVGEEFGTDACTTFSGDDREAIAEKEEAKRPRIYEQTLF